MHFQPMHGAVCRVLAFLPPVTALVLLARDYWLSLSASGSLNLSLVPAFLALFCPISLVIGARGASFPPRLRKARAEEQRCILVTHHASNPDLAEIAGADRRAQPEVVGRVHLNGAGPAKAEPRVCIGPEAPLLGSGKDIRRIVSEAGVHQVTIVLVPHEDRWPDEVVSELHGLPVRMRVVPAKNGSGLEKAPNLARGGRNRLLDGPVISPGERRVKRTIDILVAGLGLVVLAPLMAVIAVAVKLDSPGPALFRQTRVGKDGLLFTMLKFRSMTDGADAALRSGQVKRDSDGKPIHKSENDQRVTRVGRFIRHTSLDELPQLVNVLRGEMTLVGPRPEMPCLLQFYEPWQWARFAVPQGMTGWWQINGRAEHLMHLHPEYDLFYVQNYSLKLDLWILLKTASAVISGRGAF